MWSKSVPLVQRRNVLLVIDDEPLVRGIVRRALEPEIAVIEAYSGEAALALLDCPEPSVDVVLTDFMLSGISGLEVIAVLAEFRPELSLIGMTGHTDPALREAAVKFGVRVLQKPFEMGALITSVREVLAESRDRLTVSGRKHGEVGSHARGAGLVSLVAVAERRTLRFTPRSSGS